MRRKEIITDLMSAIISQKEHVPLLVYSGNHCISMYALKVEKTRRNKAKRVLKRDGERLCVESE